MRNEHDFVVQLQELFRANGWRVDVPAADDSPVDFHMAKGSWRYAVEVKAAREPRRALVEGVLASAILRARAGASEVGAIPLAVVCAPIISEAFLRELGDFVARFGAGAGWGAMDDSGLAIFFGPGLEDIKRARRRVVRPSPLGSRAEPLSDLGQWMAKVVASNRLPLELMMHSWADGARIDQPIENVVGLARVAGVSVASASRFVASLRHERFLAEGIEFRLIREREFLDRWLAVGRRRPLELRARWLFPQKDPLRKLDAVLRDHEQRPNDRACLGLFAACDRLGFRFVSGVAPHLYVENVSPERIQRLGMRIAEPGESADVLVREPHFPESVFRGAIEVEGVPVSDVVQCWLDVAAHPARGEEMAAHLFDKVIAPSFLHGGA